MTETTTPKFQPLSMMDLRSRPGEILDAVADGSRAFVIERNGQQKACLVPISHFLPDIPTERIGEELEKLGNNDELYRVVFSDSKEIQLVFPKADQKKEIDITVTLPHGYPVKAPLVHAEPIDDDCSNRWHDGSLGIFGMMESWNPSEHNIVHALALSRRWLAEYAQWQSSGAWPEEARVEK